MSARFISIESMTVFVCDKCGRSVEVRGPDDCANSMSIKCRCGGKMLRQSEEAPNEMRDMDYELGRDE
jgi:DNA-directed RNA polymerase subunit RPC12/RpoP